MTKYKVVHETIGGWYVIVINKTGEDKFYGFRDEAHAQAWAAKRLEKTRLAQIGSLNQLGANAACGR